MQIQTCSLLYYLNENTSETLATWRAHTLNTHYFMGLLSIQQFDYTLLTHLLIHSFWECSHENGGWRLWMKKSNKNRTENKRSSNTGTSWFILSFGRTWWKITWTCGWNRAFIAWIKTERSLFSHRNPSVELSKTLNSQLWLWLDGAPRAAHCFIWSAIYLGNSTGPCSSKSTATQPVQTRLSPFFLKSLTNIHKKENGVVFENDTI